MLSINSWEKTRNSMPEARYEGHFKVDRLAAQAIGRESETMIYKSATPLSPLNLS
jgi:hypothetical protein